MFIFIGLIQYCSQMSPEIFFVVCKTEFKQIAREEYGHSFTLLIRNNSLAKSFTVSSI